MTNPIFGHEATQSGGQAPPPVRTGEAPVLHETNHNDPAHIRKEIKVYLWVFAGLAFLTGLTVWLCYGLNMPVHYAIMIALAVATIKGFLVAGFFMHLLTERKLIYGILALTVFFFGVLMWGPVHDILDKFGH